MFAGHLCALKIRADQVRRNILLNIILFQTKKK